MFLTETNLSLEAEPFTVKKWKKKQFYMDNHDHAHYEITYLCQGERKYFIKDRVYSAAQGDLIFIAPDDIHRGMDAANSHYEKIEIAFQPYWFDKARKAIPELDLGMMFAADHRILRLLPEEQQYVELLCSRILYEAKHRSIGSMHEIGTLVGQLLLFSVRVLLETDGRHLQLRSSHDKMELILRYINAHYSQPITLDGLARHFHFNPSYLSTKFKDDTGFTFVEYVTSVRLREVRRLLLSTNLTISEICALTGYNNITHLGRVFKSKFGTTPSLYRKSYLWNPPSIPPLYTSDTVMGRFP